MTVREERGGGRKEAWLRESLSEMDSLADYSNYARASEVDFATVSFKADSYRHRASSRSAWEVTEMSSRSSSR